MKSLTLALGLLLVVAGLSLTVADIPANCHGDDVYGQWAFFMTDVLGNNTISCPHDLPVSSTYLVALQPPNLALDEFGVVGTWTMIYNQGFEVDIGGRKFFAFSAYSIVNASTVISECSLTEVGFYHDRPSAPGVPPFNWGCYFGSRLAPAAPVRRVGSLVASTEQATTTFDHPAEFATRLNTAQSSWTARPRPDLVGTTLPSLARSLGLNVPKARYADRRSRSARAVRDLRPDSIRYAGLPDNFDWTNITGVNFDSPMRDQLSCGSCYTFATTSMLEGRVRVASNNTNRALLSPQDIVSCSVYSQGCDGGFAYLSAKYAQDFGLATEQCFPYDSGIINSELGNGEVSCALRCNDPSQLWYTSDYEYVGGYYGACSEDGMMRALYQYGPLGVGIEVYPDFMHYESGIYHHVADVESPHASFFEETNHAVTLVGWGVDPVSGEKFWKVKNSWGYAFGIHGYFLIRRGTDECAIESMAMQAFPVPAQPL